MELFKRLMLILTSGIMAIGLICFKIDARKSGAGLQAVHNTKENPGKTADNVTPDTVPSLPADLPSDTDTASPTTVAEPTAVTEQPDPLADNPLRCEVYPQIHTLIEKYFKAKLTCDIEDFRNIVTDVNYVRLEAIARSTESVKDYTDLTVYTKRGYGNIDMVVYCTFNMIVPNVDSPIASIDSFYIVNDEEGNPRIFSGVLDDEVMNRLAEMDNDEEVVALKNYVSTEIAHAMERDDTLVTFWENMISGIPRDSLPEDTVTEETE